MENHHKGVWRAPRFPVDGFLLPPRELADHLLDCFWDRVYCLYPFFDRTSFQNAYDNLWISRSQPAKPLSEIDIGLGSKANSGSRSIVFACALNIIFTLGCHSADIPVSDREATAHIFFLRSKPYIGLDMLDVRTIGVVQTLLIVALYLQSTPCPNRCWYSIGVACRTGLGLGLHDSQLYENRSPFEQDFQRRTWHGCVMMDTCASSRSLVLCYMDLTDRLQDCMTYGRPSMASHLPSVPLPGAGEVASSSQYPSLIAIEFLTVSSLMSIEPGVVGEAQVLILLTSQPTRVDWMSLSGWRNSSLTTRPIYLPSSAGLVHLHQ